MRSDVFAMQRLECDGLCRLENFGFAEVAREVVDHDDLAAQCVRACERLGLGVRDYALRERVCREIVAKLSTAAACLCRGKRDAGETTKGLTPWVPSLLDEAFQRINWTPSSSATV